MASAENLSVLYISEYMTTHEQFKRYSVYISEK